MKGGWHPLPRLMAVVLSNGATIHISTAAARGRPFFANTDMFNHSLWLKDSGVKDDSSKKRTADFSKFYQRFGGVEDNDQDKKQRNAKLTKLFQ